MVVDDELDSMNLVDRVEALYRTDGMRLERSLLGAFGRADVAAEATSEAFAQLLRRGTGVRSPQAWVWRSAFAIARGMLTEPSPALFDLELIPESDTDYPADLLNALGQLSHLQRQSVVLHHYAGFTLTEVAAITGSTTGALKVHLSRGRRRLRFILGDNT